MNILAVDTAGKTAGVALSQGDRLLCRMAADFVQNEFHDCNALQNKIVLFLCFQYKCRFSKCQFML